MGVQLNIKNAEARRLAERLSALTGETITDTVTEALRARLRTVESQQAESGRAARLREHAFLDLMVGSRERWKGAMLSLDHGDLLYDEDGLPR